MSWTDRRFAHTHSKTLPQSPTDYDTVELGPGDTLYHPAGLWHQVLAVLSLIC
eukprot:SAG22_NODE_2386_length_2627_cov_4.058544_3_plen_53_part_00